MEQIAKNTLIEEIPDERDDYYSNDDIFEFTSWGADLSFRELIQQYKDEELLKPEIQRHYVWDKTAASRFIESILLGLPIPSIFLAKQDDEKLLIIDGYQRIKSVFDYVTGIFSGDNKVFKLTNSKKINERWRGKSFSELTDIEQRRISKATIHSIIFSQKKPEHNNTGMYQVFERINTSGSTLFPQEIRNCIYQGEFNNLLIALNNDKDWRTLLGEQKIDARMRDTELILRFFSLRQLYSNPPEIQTISLKKYLNEFMGNLNRKDKETDRVLKELQNIFKNFIPKVLATFGPLAFHNLPAATTKIARTKFNPTIFDSILISFCLHYSDNNDPKILNENRIKLLKDEKYLQLIRFKTTDTKRIFERINLASKYLFGI